MKPLRLFRAFLLLLALAGVAQAQTTQKPTLSGTAPDSSSYYDNGTNFFFGGGIVSNQNAVATSERGYENELTGDARVEGDVTILDHGHIWRGTNFLYNFTTGEVRAGAFKTFQTPFGLAGENLAGRTNESYTATNVVISTDDYAVPAYTIHAQRIIITPGVRFQAYHATLYLGRVPVFYFPYYERTMGQHRNNFEFEPGYRSIFGPYLLSSYNWYGYSNFNGTIHFDERVKRGLAGGPDLLLHTTNWGDAAARYYFADDHDPLADDISAPHLNHDRQRAAVVYNVTLSSNLTAKVVANYQSDPLILRDFFENEYDGNVQPHSFAEATQLGDNYVLDVMAEPRLVSFFDTVERLPDVRLEGLRQQIGVSPIYYESESSVGYFQRMFSDTNVLPNSLGVYPATGLTTSAPNYSAMRLDTYQQLTLPHTFFGWLTATPRVGGRLTYYSDVYGLGIHTNDQLRAAMDTGLDVSFKASRTWPNLVVPSLDVDGIRHIIQPEFDYAYAPAPSRSASQVPQFDYQSPSLRLLPLEFPEYNSIDSIGRQDTLRLMLRNRIQTKRNNQLEDLVNWAIYTDWNIQRGTNGSFSDLYNDVTLRPRSWMTLASSTRNDIEGGHLREAIESMTFQPTTVWSFSLGYRYLMNNDPEFLTFPNESLPGHNLFSASLYYRLNENWGVHVLEQYEAQNGAFQQQMYSIYRDLRSWTAALNVRLTQGAGQPEDFTVALTFSLKASPRFGLYSDMDQPIDRLNSSSVTDPMIR